MKANGGGSDGNGFHSKKKVLNTRVVSFKPLIPPGIIQEDLPLTPLATKLVIETREKVAAAVQGVSDQIVCIIGPCSIHDYSAALDYAKQLKQLSEKNNWSDALIILMRVYFEKPRTTVGWKGLINDPGLDGSYEINKGIRLARQILLEINEIGLPVATEFLDSISPQFTSDLVSWGAIGARTTESQIHRELASGLSCPIGFKNGTAGSIQMAVDAILSASCEHHFMGVNDQGLAAIVRTTGNPHCHVVLRGGSSGPNYSKEHIIKTVQSLKKDIPKPNGIMVDCSHGNSLKQYQNQVKVIDDISNQIQNVFDPEDPSNKICGVMIESNIVCGNQKLNVGVTDPKSLIYGKSVTDECVDLETTEKMLNVLSAAVLKRRDNLARK